MQSELDKYYQLTVPIILISFFPAFLYHRGLKAKDSYFQPPLLCDKELSWDKALADHKYPDKDFSLKIKGQA
jgi:hypothetical protein